MMRKVLLAALIFAVGALGPVRSQTVPTVRIGLNQNASTVTLRSTVAFAVQQTKTRLAKFTPVLALDPASTNRVLNRADLNYRMLVELDTGRLVVLPMQPIVPIEPTGRPLELDTRPHRAASDVL